MATNVCHMGRKHLGSAERTCFKHYSTLFHIQCVMFVCARVCVCVFVSLPMHIWDTIFSFVITHIHVNVSYTLTLPFLSLCEWNVISTECIEKYYTFLTIGGAQSIAFICFGDAKRCTRWYESHRTQWRRYSLLFPFEIILFSMEMSLRARCSVLGEQRQNNIFLFFFFSFRVPTDVSVGIE